MLLGYILAITKNQLYGLELLKSSDAITSKCLLKFLQKVAFPQPPVFIFNFFNFKKHENNRFLAIKVKLLQSRRQLFRFVKKMSKTLDILSQNQVQISHFKTIQL